MDLNHFYSRHQLSLMRAATATNCLGRTEHLATAALLAHRIADFQRDLKAAAATGWRRCGETLEWAR